MEFKLNIENELNIDLDDKLDGKLMSVLNNLEDPILYWGLYKETNMVTYTY